MATNGKRHAQKIALIDQLLDSAIVAAIATLSLFAATQTVSPTAALVAFGVTFLIKLKDYRGIK